MRSNKIIGVMIIQLLSCSLLILFFSNSNASEINTAAGPSVDINSIDGINQRIDTINNDINIMAAVQSEQALIRYGVGIAKIEKRLLDLGSLKSSYKRLLNSITALNKIEDEKTAIAERFNKYHTKGMAEQPPYTLSFLDSIQEAFSAIEAYKKNVDLTIELLRKEVVDHTGELQTIERELKRYKEQQDSSEKISPKNFNWAVDELKIGLESHKVIIRAIENEIKRYEIQKNNNSDQVALYEEQIEFVRANLRYDEEDLNRQLEAVQQKKDLIQSEIQRLRDEQPAIEKEWLKAQHEFERARQSDELNIAEAYLNARNEWRKTYQFVLELKESALLMLDRQSQAWRKRYSLIGNNLSFNQLKTLRIEVEKDLNNLNRIMQIQQNYLTNIQKQIGALENKITDEGLNALIRKHLSTQLTAARKHLDRRLEYQSVIIAVDQVERRLFSEIEFKTGQPAIKEHLTDIKKDLIDFWNIEIWTVDNHSVTLGKVAIALFILIIGMIVAKFILAMIYNRFLVKSQLKETTASAVHKMLSYAAYLLVCLFALRIVNIPLTAFAFLGGAVAIGIGFGAQNLINNFISGFMILGERPINIGDLIEVDGVLGKVEEIGTRCTRVRTGENIHILVPNSSFLEKNITNWTLSDKKIRANVVVGVAYGTPVRKVEELLLKAAKQVPRVLSWPDPFILFNDFGDNALIFHVYFWVSIHRVIERRQIESDVRFNIDDLFNKEGIVIAFPQRDVHLDSVEPLKVKVVPSDGTGIQKSAE